MSSYCGDVEGWGPTSSLRPDLTQCFESTILIGLPAFLFIGASISRIFLLVTTGSRHGLGKTWVVYGSSQLLALGIVVTSIVFTVFVSQQSVGYSHATMLGAILQTVAWLFLIILNHFESEYEIRSSPFIFCYSLVSMISSAIMVRTMHDTEQTNQDYFRVLVILLALNCVHLVVESWPRGWTSVQKKSEASKYDKANFFSRITFNFMQGIVSLGYRRPIQQNDIDSLMPKHMHADISHSRLSSKWSAEKERSAIKGVQPSLFKTILFSFNTQWIPILITRLLASIMTYISPQLLKNLLGFIQSFASPNEADHKPISLGVIIAFGLFFSSVLVTLLNAQFQAASTNLGIEVRTALMSMVYRKALRLSNDARQHSTAGEITNHMSVDAERWALGLVSLPTMLSVPIEMGIAVWMLYELIGWSIFVGLGAVVITLPLHARLSKYFITSRSAIMKVMDSRMRLVNEVLGGMKIVRLYDWENSFKKRISEVRVKEVKLLKQFGAIFSVVGLVFMSTPLVITLISLAVYATHGGPNGGPGDINPQTIFVSISLFGLLSRPISTLSSTISQVTGVTVATGRIQKFLLTEDLDESVIIREVETGQDDSSPVIEIKNGVFAWCPEHAPIESEDQKRPREKEEAKESKKAGSKSKQSEKSVPVKKEDEEVDYSPTLSDINLSVTKGSLTAVVGRVGQGKSSLLSALIGEMYKRQGTVRIRGRIAYVAQQAWIINASLRDNITFGLEFNKERYDTIVSASGLLPDIDMLPAGDMTEIGERGINLSGGQKQRVSLARAAYQDADVYLLDDPLSAVDAHVDQHLWKNMIGPDGLLKDKTRLLVTHGIHHLEQVDHIVVVKDGGISEQGHYDELMEIGNGFYQLIDEYSVKNQKKRETSEIESVETINDTATNDEADKVKNEIDSKKGDIVESKKVIEDPKKAEKAGELIAAEKMVMGRVSWGVYKIYFQAAGYYNSFLGVFLFLVVQSCQIGTNLWLEHWTSISNSDKQSPALFLGVYAALMVVYMFLNFAVTYVFMVLIGVRAASKLHDDLLNSVLRLPMSFFDTTPLGRIVNRFSTDISSTDNFVPWNIFAVVMFGVYVLGTIVVLASTTPIILVMIPPLGFIFVLIQSYYLRSSRALKRIDSTSRSPVYQHFSETLVGVSTIRAMGAEGRFITDNETKSTVSANAFFTLQMVARWLQVRLETLGASIVLVAALFSVLNRSSLSPGMVGLALSYALTITQDITMLVRSNTELQNQLVSVERIDEYLRKNHEAPSAMESDKDLPKNWPQAGQVEFKNYSTRYRQGLDLVIKDISFTVQPAEKIGICGRTGAGKSSLTLALFRIVEAANSQWAIASHNGPDADTIPAKEIETIDLDSVEVDKDGGSIWIDGVDISTVGLSRLRKHLAIIPQDPTLFAGTVRENLDPFNELQDAELWVALERAHLKDYITSLSGGLSFKISQNGDNFSVGQRSLICLARALLRKSKILVLDEATAAVDVETDELIQKTIRKEFKDRTILTIAHRIKTIMDSDKILVLEKGQLMEYDSPNILLGNTESHFYKLAQQAGEIREGDD